MVRERGHERETQQELAQVPRLLEWARDGDSLAFANLVRIFDLRLRGLAYQLLGDRELMDDVLQEAYLRAFRALPGFEGRADVGTWLHRITYNACIDELRRRKRRRWISSDVSRFEEVPATDPEPGERLAQTGALRQALAQLTHEERAAVWLVDAEGRDYRESAALIGIPEGTLASRLSRARGALRKALGEGEVR